MTINFKKKQHIIFRTVLTGLALFLSIGSITAQETYYKYWISLMDKKGTPYEISAPEKFLSQAAIDRRKKFNIAIDETDLPVAPNYIDKIGKTKGVKVLYTSKWMNAVVVQTEHDYDIDVIEDFDFVKEVKPLGKWEIKKTEEDKDDKKAAKTDDFDDQSEENSFQKNVKLSLNDIIFRGYGESYDQVRQLNLIKMHDLGFKGNGITISVIDAGFRNYFRHRALDSLRANGQIKGYYNVVNERINDNDNGQHGLQVLSCIGANTPNNMLGTAYKANFYLITSEDEKSEFPIEEANWVRAAEYADSIGTDIITSSLGYTDFNDKGLSHVYKDMNGKTSYASVAATKAAEKGIMVLVAAGNEGDSKWKYIAAPGDADKILTIGGVDRQGEHVNFSSYGPTADGRIKPDLCAKASYVYVAESKNNFTRSNGTSFATPLMAGAVACLMQANPNKTVAEIIEALRKSADQNHDPNNTYGYGIPDIWIAHSLLGNNPYFDYDKDELIYPAFNDMDKRLAYRFYSASNQTVQIKLTKTGKKPKVIFEKSETVNAKAYVAGEIPKIANLKTGDYVFTLTTENGEVYTREIKHVFIKKKYRK